MKSARQARALWRISHIAKSSTRLVSQGQSVSSLAISVSPDAPTTRPLDNVLIRSRQFSSRSTTALAVPLAPSPSNATSRPETLILDSSKRMVSSGNGAFQYTIGDIMDSVIKVFATSSTSHYLVPWQNRPLREGMGSGFIIDRKRIITNAHVVSDAVQVMVRRPGSPVKYQARVVAAGHECDLAILEVDDDDFWEPLRYKGYKGIEDMPPPAFGSPAVTLGDEARQAIQKAGVPAEPVSHPASGPSEHPGNFEEVAKTLQDTESSEPADALKLEGDAAPPSFGELRFSDEIPHLQDDICVIGYPLGGDNVCITQGVVSRVEPVHYAHSGSNLLAVQIDAAINPGNSGGPAFVDGKVVGVAFQNIQSANNVGYIIPIPIIRHFLTDVEKGGYKVERNYAAAIGSTGTVPEPIDVAHRRGFCVLGINCQGMNNTALQKYLGIIPSPRHPSLLPSSPSSTTSSPSASTTSPDKSTIAPASSSSSLGPAYTTHPHTSLTPSAAAWVNGTRPLFQVAKNPAAYAHFKDKRAIPSGTNVITPDTPTATTASHPPSSTYAGDNDVSSARPSPVASSTSLSSHSPSDAQSMNTLPPIGGHRYVDGPSQPLTGVLVNRVEAQSACKGILQRHDVLVAVDGHPIACDGTVPFRGRERITFDYLISLKYTGELVKLTFLRRNPKHSTVKAIPPPSSPSSSSTTSSDAAAIPATETSSPSSTNEPRYEVELLERYVRIQPHDYLVSVFEFDRVPKYYLFGGICYAPLTQPYLHEFGKDWMAHAPRELVSLALHGTKLFPKHEIVVIAQLLPANCNIGYSHMQDSIVRRINGIEVRNVAHVSRIIERAILNSARAYEREVVYPKLSTNQATNESTIIPLPLSSAHPTTGCSTSSPYHDYFMMTGLTLRTDFAKLKEEGLHTYEEGQADPDDVNPYPPNSANPYGLLPSMCDPEGETKGGDAVALQGDVHRLIIEMADMRMVVLDLAEACQEHRQLMAKHRVPTDRSGLPESKLPLAEADSSSVKVAETITKSNVSEVQG